jgi:hypothetical protein
LAGIFHHRIISFVKSRRWIFVPLLMLYKTGVTGVLLHPLSYVSYRFRVRRNRKMGVSTIVYYCWVPRDYLNVEYLLERVVRAFRAEIFVFYSSKGTEEEIRTDHPKIRIMVNRHFFLPLTKADLFISSVGSDEALFPKRAKRLYLFHSLIGIGTYPKGEFDGYRYFYCSDREKYTFLSRLFENEPNGNRQLIQGGYPKLDLLAEKIPKNPRPAHKGKPTIIYAPTYECLETREHATLGRYGGKIVQLLLQEYRVIFRPHPINTYDEFRPVVEKMRDDFTGSRDFLFDVSKDYFDIYLSTDLMVTDSSGTALTYALAFEKPVVFVCPGAEDPPTVPFHVQRQVGATVREVAELKEVVRSVLQESNEYVTRIKRFRDGFLFNQGRSIPHFLDVITRLLANDLRA